MGPAVTARSPEAHRRELGLMCVTHNITIVGPGELFYRASWERKRDGQGGVRLEGHFFFPPNVKQSFAGLQYDKLSQPFADALTDILANGSAVFYRHLISTQDWEIDLYTCQLPLLQLVLWF
jgi:hypothetical protein